MANCERLKTAQVVSAVRLCYEAAMRFVFRWAFRLVLLLIVFIVALVLLKDVLLRSIAEHQLRAQTGLDAKIDRLQSRLWPATLTLENLKLYNTAEFGGSPLADVPELHVECEPGGLARGRLHFKLVRLRLNEINIVESKDGRTNIATFVRELQSSSSASRGGRSGGLFDFGGIDVLNLTLAKIRYSNLKQPAKGVDVQVGLKNEILTGIKTLPELSDLIMNILFRRGITITSDGGRASIAVNPKPEARASTNRVRSAVSHPQAQPQLAR
jgi:uncharacterized protein involved in outer membrane biogenesis